MDGVFICYYDNSNDYLHIELPERWPKFQSAGEIATGVLVVEGGKYVLVAPTEADVRWSSAEVKASNGSQNFDTVLNDWNGKANTTEQMKHSECNTKDYAPGFCATYSRANANGAGLLAGDWWLPSAGELMMIYANRGKINYALSLINGATPLTNFGYWSSLEYNEKFTWTVMVISKASSASEFLNSWIHEMLHLCRHVCRAFGIDPYGEEAAYFSGDVGQKMFRVARRFVCDCCRGKHGIGG